MKRKNKNNGSTSDQRIARIAFRLHGQELSQIQDVQEMLSLNSELDAVRYLMRRGLEAMSATLASRQASKKMQAQVSTEAIVREMIKAGFTPEEAKK